MKIGLIRHFKVKNKPPRKWMTPTELDQWFSDYDTSDIEIGITEPCSEWDICYSSDIFRAEKTAQSIYKGEIITAEELREIPAYSLFHEKIRLPYFLWMVTVRIAWLFNHKSQLESKINANKRAEAIIDVILSKQNRNILIVSHGGFILFIKRVLLKRGFKGPGIMSPINGKMYVFEKK
ncbi:histidine phosphatase family protein [Bacillus sp. PAMC26568]|nr:histidine phosphatase family protein [Bacillus sp. PAMC26568]